MNISKIVGVTAIALLTTNLVAVDYNQLESDRTRMKKVEKSLNFLLEDFQTMQKAMITLSVENQKLSDRVKDLETLQITEVAAVSETTVEVETYIVSGEFATSYVEMSEISEVKNLYVQGDTISGTPIDSIWMQTQSGRYIQLNQLEIKQNNENN